MGQKWNCVTKCTKITVLKTQSVPYCIAAGSTEATTSTAFSVSTGSSDFSVASSLMVSSSFIGRGREPSGRSILHLTSNTSLADNVNLWNSQGEWR